MSMGKVWNEVVALKSKDKRHTSDGIAWQNNLMRDELQTIFATVDFFGGDVPQVMADLSAKPQKMNVNGKIMLMPPPRFPVFDWLGMGVMSDRLGNDTITKVLAHSFLKVEGDIDEFIKDLRITDYDIDESWKEIDLTA